MSRRNTTLDVVIMVASLMNLAIALYTHRNLQQTKYDTCVNNAYWTCRTTLGWPTAECDAKAEESCR